MIELKVDEKELRQIQKDLDKLLPFDRGTKTIVRQAMRKAMKPMVKELKDLVGKNKKNPKATGDLKRSIGLINIRNSRNAPPVVAVGPRKTSKGKQEGTDLLPTGYMIFMEYGTPTISAQRNLDKAEKSKYNEVINSIVPSLRSIIEKRFKKKGL